MGTSIKSNRKTSPIYLSSIFPIQNHRKTWVHPQKSSKHHTLSALFPSKVTAFHGVNPSRSVEMPRPTAILSCSTKASDWDLPWLKPGQKAGERGRQVPFLHIFWWILRPFYIFFSGCYPLARPVHLHSMRRSKSFELGPRNKAESRFPHRQR